METITTSEAERRYQGIKAAQVRNWCKKGKINGAPKSGSRGEWHFSPTDFENFLHKEHPELFLQTRQSFEQTSKQESTLNAQIKTSSPLQRIIESAIARLIALISDFLTVISLIIALLVYFVSLLTNKTFQYILSGTAILLCCVTFGYVLYAKNDISRKKKLRYTNPNLRKIAWGILSLLLIGFAFNTWYFWQWYFGPPEKTVILVAEFINLNDGYDSGKITSNLIDNMNSILKEFPQIEVIHLNQPITEEKGGSIFAKEVAEAPEYKAAVVIWGDYSEQLQETELTVHVDIIRESVTYYAGLNIYAGMGRNLSETYPQGQIELMANRERLASGSTQTPRANKWSFFKLALSKRLGHLVAFIEALALYSAGEHKSAIPLFEDAVKAIENIDSDPLDRAIQFYGAANLISSGQIDNGLKGLLPLMPKDDIPNESVDSWGALAVATSGIVAQLYGESKQSLQYLNRALDIYTSTNNTFGQAETLKYLSLVHFIDADLQLAQVQAKEALDLYTKVSDNLGQGETLSLLGIISWTEHIKKKSNSISDIENLMQRALRQFRQAGNIIGVAQTYMILATVTSYESKNSSYYYSYAKSTYKKILRLNIPIYNQISLLNLGGMAISQHDFPSAYEYLNLSLNEAKRRGDTIFQGVNLIYLLIVDLISRDFLQAQERREQISTHISNYNLWQLYPLYIANLEIGAKFLTSKENYLLIKDYYSEALQIYQSQGDVAGQIRELTNLGEVAYQEQKYEEVGQYFSEAQNLLSELNEPLVQDLSRLGYLALSMGDNARKVATLIDEPTMLITSVAYYSTAEEIFRRLDMKPNQAQALGAIGIILFEQGEVPIARQFIETSIKIYIEIGYTIPASILDTSNKLNTQP